MRAFVLRLGSAAPLGLNKCVPIINPGLAPWAVQEYRPYRAPLRLPIYFIILMRLPYNQSTFVVSTNSLSTSWYSFSVPLQSEYWDNT